MKKNLLLPGIVLVLMAPTHLRAYPDSESDKTANEQAGLTEKSVNYNPNTEVKPMTHSEMWDILDRDRNMSDYEHLNGFIFSMFCQGDGGPMPPMVLNTPDLTFSVTEAPPTEELPVVGDLGEQVDEHM
jgi:hypothetical protein